MPYSKDIEQRDTAAGGRTMNRFRTITHPESGERYAAEIGPSDHYEGQDRILKVAGPLHHSDPTDPDSLADYLDNQDPDDAELDAEWFSLEIAAAAGFNVGLLYGDTLHGALADL